MNPVLRQVGSGKWAACLPDKPTALQHKKQRRDSALHPPIRDRPAATVTTIGPVPPVTTAPPAPTRGLSSYSPAAVVGCQRPTKSPPLPTPSAAPQLQAIGAPTGIPPHSSSKVLAAVSGRHPIALPKRSRAVNRPSYGLPAVSWLGPAKTVWLADSAPADRQ